MGIIKETLKNKSFSLGLVCNYISLIFMALGGFCYTFLVGFFYDVETLGYFNTFYAIYITASQIAVFGCQNAVTKYVSEKPMDIVRAKKYMFSAVGIVFMVSVVLNLILRPLLLVFNATISIVEVNAVLIGVFVFALNKVILGYLNGLSRMVEYGIFQTVRYVLIAGFLLLLSMYRVERQYLLLCFLFAEVLLLIIEIPSVLKFGYNNFKVERKILIDVFVFGKNILPANMVLELNSKIDVLCLAFVTRNERIVGIYSFAVLFSEGFYQLYVVLRRSINPKIAFDYTNGLWADFYSKANGIIKRYGYILSFLCAIILVFVYLLACKWMKGSEYIEGLMPLVIVLVGIIFNSKSIIWGNVLSSIGKPKYEATVNLLTVMSNLILNLVFIKLYGMIGAAVGTASSYFLFSLVQNHYIKKGNV